MAQRTWYPYAPDQAFGHQAALDEALVDSILNALDQQRDAPPRAAGKAMPAGADAPRPGIGWRPTNPQLAWLAVEQPECPSTIAAALDAAPWIRSGDRAGR
jgi:hypothetical protein